MKNKFLLLFSIIWIFVVFQVFADENRFEVENIELQNYGDLIIAKNGKFNSVDRELEILAINFFTIKKIKF